MGNKRGEIRAALKALLETNLSGYTVLTSRQVSLSALEQLPGIIIYTPDEPVTQEAMGSKRYIRNLELRIELTIEATEDTDDDLDTRIKDIETLMSNNPSISGTVLATTQIHTQTDLGVDGDKYIGIGTMIFECKYVS